MVGFLVLLASGDFVKDTRGNDVSLEHSSSATPHRTADQPIGAGTPVAGAEDLVSAKSERRAVFVQDPSRTAKRGATDSRNRNRH